MELIYPFLKAGMLALCGQTWRRKTKEPGENNRTRMGDHFQQHVLTRIQTRIAEVTSKCVIQYAVQVPYTNPKPEKNTLIP